MANRKVLINRHSTKNLAPSASEMFHGEIAVSHPEGLTGLSATTIWTRNNDTMVPFASCAMTKQMIDNAIQEADVTYDVKAASNDKHVEVATAGTKEKVFTVSSKDVMSEEEFKTYSANTAEAIAELLDVVLTGVTGDDIILATLNGPTGASNTVSLAHKKAITTDGFNKLTTDAFGHVTAATPVTTADIQALGFKTSAETGEDLKALSASVVTNKTNIEALSAGTQHDIKALSGDVVEYVKVVSGNIETVINELSANTTAGDAAVFASAKTYTDEAIEALDSEGKVSAAGKYLTGIGIADGKISGITEADLPTLTKVVSGAGNVFTDIEVNDHEIVINKGMTVASDADLQALSGAVGSFSGATDAKFTELSAYTKDVDDKVNALSAGTIQLSADTIAYVNTVSGNIESVILAMDKDADAVDGKVVTTVAQENGKVTETKANVKDLQLGGYVKDAAATGDIADTDTINAALSKLENKSNANKIANADGSINVTTAATGTDINVNIKSGEHVLAKDGNAGLYTNIKLSAVTASSDLVKEEYALYGTDNTILGDHIKIYKDQSLVSITLEDNDGSGHTGQYLKYTYIDASGATQSTYVNVSSFLVEAEFATGVTADASGVVHGVVDPASEKDSNNDSFLTVGADGFKVDGIKDEIDAKIAALDKTDDAAVAGQYVAAIQEADGIVSVKTRANVSDAVLTGYAKGEKPASTAIAATDDVKGAIAKLEHQIDDAKAAATTKVVEGTDAGNNMTIVSATGADNSVTYTVNLTDVASKAALDAEIAARKAVDGQNGQTYAANTGANYIAAATSLNDADVKLDAAIKAEETARIAAIEALDSVGSASTTGHYLTSVTITDGKISAVGEVAVPANVAITATTGAAVSTPSAVLTGVTADGTDNHNLTFGMSNKVFSASTSDSAQTSVSANMAYELSSAATISSGQVRDLENVIKSIKVNSATTAESADTAASANKVANALSVSGYSDSSASTLNTAIAYDGSEAKSLTFGTNGNAGLKSMSMTSAGLVDVEVIDCGEY